MSVTGTNTESGQSEPTTTDAGTAGSGAAVSLLAGPVATDNCSNCGAALAPDQRYCVECGTRRGKARFALELPAAQPAAPAAPEPIRGASGPSAFSTTTIVGVLVALLLAVGIGLLIGHWTSGTAKVRVNVAGATTGTGGSTSSTGGSGGTTSGGGSTTGSSGSSSGSTVKPGGSCTKGTPGCQNGKETGNFFGG